ncbi:DUF2271 domain-containing protein [Sessilibacter sp. MAH1]
MAFRFRSIYTLLFAVNIFSFAHSTYSSELNISIKIPELNVAEYHNPYVAIWIENQDDKSVTDVQVWYNAKMRDKEGNKWLKDLRQWWRKSGRSLDMPVDAITAATKGPGKYNLNFIADDKKLKNLTPGNYRLRIEAAREVGGRELLDIPFQWPIKNAATAKAQGESELGEVILSLKP